MNVSPHYRKPLLWAILFHVLLFFILILTVTPPSFRMPASSAPVGTVQATAITEAQFDQKMQAAHQTQVLAQEKIQQKVQQKVAAEKAAAVKKMQMELAAKQALAAKLALQEKTEAHQQLVKKQAAIKAQKEKVFRDLLKKQALASVKNDVDTKQQQQAKKLALQQKKLQEQLMQQQMMHEQKNISSVVSQAQEGIIDKYKAEILALIQSNWHIDKVDSKLKCVYAVTLGPDGSVIAESLMKSSGDDSLDQSARQAILNSSPLPVPTDPTLFNHFRRLVLTLSPQGYLQSVGN